MRLGGGGGGFGGLGGGGFRGLGGNMGNPFNYSITSPARASNVGGTMRPSAF